MITSLAPARRSSSPQRSLLAVTMIFSWAFSVCDIRVIDRLRLGSSVVTNNALAVSTLACFNTSSSIPASPLMTRYPMSAAIAALPSSRSITTSCRPARFSWPASSCPRLSNPITTTCPDRASSVRCIERFSRNATTSGLESIPVSWLMA